MCLDYISWFISRQVLGYLRRLIEFYVANLFYAVLRVDRDSHTYAHRHIVYPVILSNLI